MCDKLIVIDRQHREMWSPLRRLNQNFCQILVANDEMLVALATGDRIGHDLELWDGF